MASPTLFLVAAEAGLRLFGYGYSTSFFVRDEANQCYRANEKFGWRFYRPGVAKMPMPFSVPLEKPEETYRVFIVGSSAAWGTPSPSFSFGRVLEKMLRQRHPGVRLEVVNTAMMGINSHIVSADRPGVCGAAARSVRDLHRETTSASASTARRPISCRVFR